eukprot:TRINITY_DN1372_c0_g2_i2.p1 TRINITY_DN1372_c0_g2~~TRINITY_DN1372_c0_g2_i2.p1  ORF type:complete len:618 (-),score=197.96 TRINITY_DN1372_c0_g2_i2:96-1949(-)
MNPILAFRQAHLQKKAQKTEEPKVESEEKSQSERGKITNNETTSESHNTNPTPHDDVSSPKTPKLGHTGDDPETVHEITRDSSTTSLDSIDTPPTAKHNHEEGVMDQYCFRKLRRPLDMAIYLSNLEQIIQQKKEFEAQMKLKIPTDDVLPEIANLMKKANDTMVALGGTDSTGTPKITKKRNSLRTNARLSHLKLMAGTKSESELTNQTSLPIDRDHVEGAIMALCLSRITHPFCAETVAFIMDTITKVKAEIDGTPIIHLPKLKTLVMNKVRIYNHRQIHLDVDGDWKYAVHLHSVQGKRSTMEDRSIFIPNINRLLGLETQTPIMYCGIFDGHGGENAAEFSKLGLHMNILRNFQAGDDLLQLMSRGFLETDSQFSGIAKTMNDKSGSTALTIFIQDENLYVGNVGDTSAYLFRTDGEIISLTTEHKASSESEKKRVKESGGIVVWYSGGWRVNGSMAVSRSIGDCSVASIIAQPAVLKHEIQVEDDFIVMATDGLWDVLKPDEVWNLVQEWRKSRDQHSLERRNSQLEIWEEHVNQDVTGKEEADRSKLMHSSGGHDHSDDDDDRLLNAADALVEAALEKQSPDNTTVVIIFLKESGRGQRPDQICSAYVEPH